MEVAFINIQFAVVGNTEIYPYSRDQSDSVRLFLEWLVVDSESADGVDIDHDGCHLDVSEVEGLRKLFNFSILREKTTSVEVVPLTWGSLQVDICVGSPVPLSELLQHLQFSLEFTPLNIWTRHIHEDFSSIESSIDHWIVWDPGFLAYFIG